MVCFPPAKINLGLQVTNKRADGYHDLITCFYPIPLTDVLEIVPASTFSFSTSGRVIPDGMNGNLCVKAWQKLHQGHNAKPVSIHLHKIIPTGAGLGGGSSNAAWTLRVVNTLQGGMISADRLRQTALQLGSDCPFFLQDNPMLGRGRGELLSAVNVSLKDRFLVLVKPDVHVSTAAAFAGIRPRNPEYDLRQVVETLPLSEWKKFLTNDFEETIIEKYPGIAAVKRELYDAGASYASMTGSGAAVYGIFDEEVDLSGRFAGMFYAGCRLS